MKHPIVLLALVVFCASSPVCAQDAAKIANIEELFRLSNMDHMQQQINLRYPLLSQFH